MPTLNEWKALSDQARKEFLKDRNKFTSYDQKDYDLANSVVEDLREVIKYKLGKISIGGKGGYFIFLVEVPEHNYDSVVSLNIGRHLGFAIFYHKPQL